MKCARIALLVGLLLPPAGRADDEPQWDLAALRRAPAWAPARQAGAPGVEAIYVEGLPLRGKPTRFFAYLALPTNAAAKAPGVVLVHGGGGTAFADWARYWAAKGYVAIAPDTCGGIPVPAGTNGKAWTRIDSLGLPWGGGPDRPSQPFGDFALPDDEQWAHHAVAQALRSVSLLAERPDVDHGKIGLVGISWGSVIGSLAAGLDDRLAFVVVQYIGGNLDLGNVWYDFMQSNPATFRWDPAKFYAPYKGRTHWLWIDGVNDKYGLPPMITKSWRQTGPNSWMTLLPTQGHGHAWKETGKDALREIYAFADGVARGTPPLPRIVRTQAEKDRVTLTWRAAVPVTRVQFVYTADPVPQAQIHGEARDDWEKVRYTVQDAALPSVMALPDGSTRATFPLPAGMTAGFINLVDERGLAVSCDFLRFSL